jgi:hypothetical protein
MYQTRVGQRDANYRSLLNNGLLESGETAVAARERWDSSIIKVREEISRLESEIEEKRTEVDRMSELIRTQGIELAGHEVKCRSLEDSIAEAGRRKTKLEGDRYILDLTGGKLPDLEFPKIMEGLKVRISHLQQLIIQAEVDSAEDLHLNRSAWSPSRIIGKPSAAREYKATKGKAGVGLHCNAFVAPMGANITREDSRKDPRHGSSAMASRIGIRN